MIYCEGLLVNSSCCSGLSDAVSTATYACTYRGCCEHCKVAFLIDCIAVIYNAFVLFNNCRFRLMFNFAVVRCLCNSKALDDCIRVAADDVLCC